MLTTSPATMPSPSSGRAPSETSASPVFTPMRSWSSACSSRIQSRIASAARTARSASSSCATGAPNSAITASPMNFSTVPPKRSSSSRTRAWYGRSSERTSSGSMLLRARREADEVGEQHGDDLALLEPRPLAGREWRGTGIAETRAFRILLAAPRTRDHHVQPTANRGIERARRSEAAAFFGEAGERLEPWTPGLLTLRCGFVSTHDGQLATPVDSTAQTPRATRPATGPIRTSPHTPRARKADTRARQGIG